MVGAAEVAIGWLSSNSGIPALVIAAILLVLGYRILRRSARFFVQVAVVAAVLAAATHAGWLRW